ncbi:MAG: IS1595 family transposase [Syntrophobacteraceae bacterium]
MDVNLINLIEKYGSDDNKCREYLETLKWMGVVRCPRCGSEKISRIKKRGQFDCDACRYQFSVTAGTIFHDSHLPLWKWFLAVYLMAESKKGISANQLKRSLNVSYKTAWYLCHRIRKAMQEVTPSPQLCGVVEVDETYVGGKYDKRRKRGPWQKQPVMGLLQREGKFEAKTVQTTGKQVLCGIINQRIAKGSQVMTDELQAYKNLDKEGYRHGAVSHSTEEWVRGNVHTNGIENAWSLFKRSIVGSYHQISTKHMDAYLDEFEWRFNGRDNAYLFRDTLIRLLNAPKMEFKELITKSA